MVINIITINEEYLKNLKIPKDAMNIIDSHFENNIKKFDDLSTISLVRSDHAHMLNLLNLLTKKNFQGVLDYFSKIDSDVRNEFIEIIEISNGKSKKI